MIRNLLFSDEEIVLVYGDCLQTEKDNETFENILKHPNIFVMLGVEFDKSMEDEFDHVFNCMAIDEYYDYCYE